MLAYEIARPAVRYVLQDVGMKAQENVSILAGMILFVGFNYIGQRFFAFSTRKSEERAE